MRSYEWLKLLIEVPSKGGIDPKFDHWLRFPMSHSFCTEFLAENGMHVMRDSVILLLMCASKSRCSLACIRVSCIHGFECPSSSTTPNYGPVILEGLEELDDVWVVHHLHDGLRGGSFKGTTMATMVKSWGNCTVKRAKRENSLVKLSNPGSVKMLVRCRNWILPTGKPAPSPARPKRKKAKKAKAVTSSVASVASVARSKPNPQHHTISCLKRSKFFIWDLEMVFTARMACATLPPPSPLETTVCDITMPCLSRDVVRLADGSVGSFAQLLLVQLVVVLSLLRLMADSKLFCRALQPSW